MKSIALSIFLILLSITSLSASNSQLRTIMVNVATKEGELRTEIHYAEKDQAVALRAVEIIKNDLTKIVEYFHYIPREPVHFNIDPYLHVTNGNASPFPTNIINLYNFPSSNLEHLIIMEDWLQGLMLHEFTHITHLDQTRGYLETGRSIFGTIAKVPPGIVPRWFTEGIAVWAESHFLTQHGRLQNELLNKDLWILLQNKKFCSTIDCLDAPDGYPHGQLAYWAGGHFMEYLENKKADTIRCLVETNSRRIPFFLNGAFEACGGATANELFRQFRADYLKKYNENELIKENGENIFGADDYQKGNAHIGDLLLKVETDQKKSALVRYDLKAKVSSYHLYSEMIDHIGSTIKLDNDTDGVLVAFNDDPQYIDHNKVWKIINIDTLLVEKNLNFLHDPSYVLPIAPDIYLGFTYEENHWRAYKIDKDGEKLLKEWPLKYNLVGVSQNLDQVNLKINTAGVGTKTYSTNINLEQLPEFLDDEKKNTPEITNYPTLDHLKPHYWFLATGTTSNPSSIGISTAFSDPMYVHNLATTALIYPSISRLGGSADYIYTDHLWKNYFKFLRDFSTNSWSSNINKEDDTLIGTSYDFLMKKWIYTPELFLGKSSTNDAISAEKNNYWSFTQVISYRAQSVADFWQQFLLTVESGATYPDNGASYARLISKLNSTVNLSDDLAFNVKSAYGKLYKTTFNRGVLYGGGLDQIQLLRTFEFYGLPYYGDAFGNKIYTARFTSDFNLWNIYSGREFIPVYLKEIHLLAGLETLGADRIYIDQNFYANKSIQDWFIGTKFMTNLFYFIPANFNFIYSVTSTPSSKHIGLWNIFLNLEL